MFASSETYLLQSQGQSFLMGQESKSSHELIKALQRYLDETGETEREVASRIGIDRHTLHRWLSDVQSPPKEGKLALTAFFLRRAGYL
jgi:hypothetical protein